MNSHIQSIYASGRVTGKSGQEHALTGAIDPEEGEFLHGIIAGDASVTRTLEVGCANGLSALHICEATRSRPGARHTIVDPFQNTQWDGAGVRNLENAGIDFFRLVEKKSEFALPGLLEEGEGALRLYLRRRLAHLRPHAARLLLRHAAAARGRLPRDRRRGDAAGAQMRGPSPGLIPAMNRWPWFRGPSGTAARCNLPG